MARVFTICFEFCEEKHIAMVTMQVDYLNETVYQIRLFNQNLYSIIPEGKISFTSTDNALPAQVQNHLAEALFLSVKSALNTYLHQPITTARS